MSLKRYETFFREATEFFLDNIDVDVITGYPLKREVIHVGDYKTSYFKNRNGRFRPF